MIRNLFDRAGQIYCKQEQLQRIEHPEGFAWKLLNNLAVSELRRSEERVKCGSVAGPAGEKRLSTMASCSGTSEQLLNHVYAREIYDQLSRVEQRCATLRTLGYTSGEVAGALLLTTAAVDKIMQRLRDRFRK